MLDNIINFINGLSPMQQLALFSFIKIACIIGIVMGIVAYSTLAERKICAFIQNRHGPNRVGPWGLLQPAIDGIKSFLKEDLTPGHVRKFYFWLAPALSMGPALITLAVIPFGSQIPLGSHFAPLQVVIADLNVGVLYTFGIVSIGVYGIVLAGYSANSKYPFIGSLRSSAQLISYEIAMGLSVIPLFMLVESLNLSKVIHYQSGTMLGFIPNWLVFKEPIAFMIFVIAALAETNRMPFDFPESEQELVGGYNTEYSSMKFALFFMGEYANIVASAAMMVTLFLGGWTLPFGGLDHTATTVWIGLAQIGIFFAKVAALIFCVIWVRWMWPRFRFDQLMGLGWKKLIPLALANILATALFLWLGR